YNGKNGYSFKIAGRVYNAKSLNHATKEIDKFTAQKHAEDKKSVTKTPKSVTKKTDAKNIKYAAQLERRIIAAIKNGKVWKTYENFEAENYHSEGVLLMAHAVGSKKDILAATDVLVEHLEAGHLPNAVHIKRDEIGRRLNKAFREKFAPSGKAEKKIEPSDFDPVKINKFYKHVIDYRATNQNKKFVWIEAKGAKEIALTAAPKNVFFYTKENGKYEISEAHTGQRVCPPEKTLPAAVTAANTRIKTAPKGIEIAISDNIKRYGRSPRYTGRHDAIEAKTKPESQPKQKVSASVGQAIKDLMTVNPEMKKLGALFLGMFYADFKNKGRVENIKGLKQSVYSKYGIKYFEDYDTVDYNKVSAATINEAGRELINKIEARHETLKSKKAGTDMFPEMQGLGSAFSPLPYIVGAVVGKTIDHFIEKKLKGSKAGAAGLGGVKKKHNELTAKRGLNGLGGGFVSLDNAHKVRSEATYTLPGELGKFIQGIPPEKYAILLEGESGAGKTDFLFQLADTFAETGKKVGIFSIEQGGVESSDTRAAIARNIREKNKPLIAITGEGYKQPSVIKQYAKNFDVVMLDSFQKLQLPSTSFDDLRQQFPNVIWVVIFQQNTAGGTRGGVASVFDTNVRIVVHKGNNPAEPFKDNWAELTKNRGNSLDVHYMVSAKTTKAGNKPVVETKKSETKK
ncbi:MAG: hypothetical protein KF900_11470, partial [Bacteroidetes bacterium]|nr:hypothetical protein [Bacteroidota bacterium]